jgi:FKBP-type peptidyl-prolyl cis-trans isomerase
VLPSGLEMQDLRAGTGAEAHVGDTVKTHYVGTLLDGTKFDSSRSRGTPIVVRIGVGQVIKGWDEGIVGMRVGQVRVLKIPPDLAYGRAGSPPVIPPNATLVFEIELLDVLP